jgi:nucleotidyltransferase substrate binding protein (TIGR01987 family)
VNHQKALDMTQDIRWQQRFDNFNRALKQLTAAVELSAQREFTQLEKQGVIQGFEFVHELAWNVLKDLLEFEGIQGIVGSRGTVREAFKRDLLADGELWLDMIDKRNLTSHTYNAELAQDMVNTIVHSYYPSFVALQLKLQQRM